VLGHCSLSRSVIFPRCRALKKIITPKSNSITPVHVGPMFLKAHFKIGSVTPLSVQLPGVS
jgi:hypothetical protein